MRRNKRRRWVGIYCYCVGGCFNFARHKERSRCCLFAITNFIIFWYERVLWGFLGILKFTFIITLIIRIIIKLCFLCISNFIAFQWGWWCTISCVVLKVFLATLPSLLKLLESQTQSKLFSRRQVFLLKTFLSHISIVSGWIIWFLWILGIHCTNSFLGNLFSQILILIILEDFLAM